MTVQVAVSRAIAAPAATIWEVISDYRNHHPRILPDRFTHLTVLEGGVGAGTVIQYGVRIAGRTQTATARIEEPEPGRVLAEVDLANGMVTTFTLDPHGEETVVTIETRMRSAFWPLGLMQRLIVPRLLGPLYRDELARIDSYARGWSRADGPPTRSVDATGDG